MVICPVGGGGLLAGTAIAVKGRSPRTRVMAAEPANADDARRSLEAGSIQRCDDPRTIADGLRTTSIGERNFAVIAGRVERIMTRDRGRDPRRDAVRLGADQDRDRTLERRRGRAAVDRQARRPTVAIGVIMSGGNVDFEAFFRDLASKSRVSSNPSLVENHHESADSWPACSRDGATGCMACLPCSCSRLAAALEPAAGAGLPCVDGRGCRS